MSQSYWKRENKSVKKDDLVEIVGTREELKPFLNTVIEAEVFVTNTTAYTGEKRLITEVRIPNTNFYIKHLWVKEYNLPLKEVSHGYQKLKLKVVKYTDTDDNIKYGVKIANEKKKPQAPLIKPKWMKD